jgi:ATP-dependent Lhr-like helicase
MSAQDVLEQPFHPLVRRWFEGCALEPFRGAHGRAGASLAHHRQSWRARAGQRADGQRQDPDRVSVRHRQPGDRPLACGAVRVLYLSPLKALNSDVRLNLLAPLAELRALFEQEKVPFPPIRVMTRSGDTPDDERRAMLRHPPEILITTPESLNLMLTGKQSRQLFGGLKPSSSTRSTPWPAASAART